MPERESELYVGYLDKSPPRFAAWCRRTVSAVLLLGLALGLILVFAQAPFDEGTYELGIDSELRGLLVERPYPLLLVPDPGTSKLLAYYLVEVGKKGSAGRVAGLDGELVRVTGSLIYSGEQRMVEVHALERLAREEMTQVEARTLGDLRQDSEIELGRMTVVGEIVDWKCYLGVMKPGRGKPHRACAVRCIGGGIPPVLRVEDRFGGVDYFLLVSSDGGSLREEVLDFAAEAVEITGEVTRAGDRLLLHADPSSYRRPRGG